MCSSGVTPNFVLGGLNICTFCQKLGANLVALLIEIPNIGGGAKAAPHSPPPWDDATDVFKGVLPIGFIMKCFHEKMEELWKGRPGLHQLRKMLKK